MTIKNLTQEIFEKSFSRDSLERLLTKEIKRKIETALGIACQDNYQTKCNEEILKETLKSD